MNFSRFFHIRHLFFLALFFPTKAFTQQHGIGNKCFASPSVSTISVLPTGIPTNFRNIASFDQGKLILSGDEHLWLFDGRNLEPIAINGKPKLRIAANGSVYIAGNNDILRLTPSENGLILSEKIFQISDALAGSSIIDIAVNSSDEVYFTTHNQLWQVFDVPKLIDSSSGGIHMYGSPQMVFYLKPTKGLFFIDSTNDAPQKVVGSEVFSSSIPLEVFNVKGGLILTQASYPWITTYANGSQRHFGDITKQVRSRKTKVKKVYFAFDEFYVLTDREGILILDSIGNLKVWLNPLSHPSIEHTVDMAINSPQYFLTLTPSGIHRFSRPETVGNYIKNNGLSSAPTGFLLTNSTLYYSTIDGVSFAQIIPKNPHRLCFDKVAGIDDQVFLLHEFERGIFTIGSEGVYRIEGGRGIRVLNNRLLDQNDFIFLHNNNDTLWLVLVNEKGVELKSLAAHSTASKIIPLPKDKGVLSKSLILNDSLFIGYIDDSWYGLGLSHNTNLWKSRGKPVDSYKANHGIDANNQQVRYGYETNQDVTGEDFSDFFVPLSKNDSLAVVVRISKAHPNYRSIWLGVYNKNGYRLTSFLGIVPPAEVPQQAFMSEDSTVWIASGSGLNYYSARRRNLEEFKPNVSIYSTSFLADSKRIYIQNGYFLEEGNAVTTKYQSPIHNLFINLSSLGFSEWSNNPEGIQFSTFIDGHDKQWTAWTQNHIREVALLGHGIYTVKAKALNIMGMESEEVSMSFYVQPRFYETRLALVAVIILMILGLYMVYRWRAYLHAKVRFMLESLINKRTEELVKEKEKTDNLLARVLPHDTASELKEKGKVDTQRFKMVTVLFSDIEGFTRITDETNPETLIDQLDKFFLYFDSVVDKYKIEKIKTIGDAYMCAGGIPEKNRTNPVEVILAALEMMLFMKSITSSSSARSKVWELRIGIDTGPVIAGVVGRSKLTYDIWGSTVNTASRMESSGEAGQINISGNTFMLVKDYFICTFRGKMPVKNKGDIQMYFVNGIKPSLSEGMQGLKPNQDFFILLQLIRLGDLEDLILEKLEKGLPKNLYYHNLKHTVDVYTQVELIGRSENVSKEEMLLLRTAALFHDAGHLVDYDTHEEMAVKLAREILPEYQYTNSQIEVISQLIMATKMPPTPKNLLEEIMCDADLDYLGRPDFLPVSNTLYRELHEHGKIGTLLEWNEMQIKFIDKHFYFTKTARRLRNVNKQSQLDKLKMWMESN